MEQWLTENGLNIIGTFVGSGLFCTAFTIYKEAEARKDETKARRVANLLAITSNHREVWAVFLNNQKELARVRNASADTAKQPITDAERVFVNMVFQQMNSAYYAMRDQLVVKLEGLRRDIAQFLSLPVPREVWEKIKVFQNDEFVAFMESCRSWK
ncbi:MAG: hypothetical protein P4N60_06735 [Verrucomicrobiae bacterium]|nr:hypothetical protein [Verrucomicrobiae bacterium]